MLEIEWPSARQKKDGSSRNMSNKNTVEQRLLIKIQKIPLEIETQDKNMMDAHKTHRGKQRDNE